MGTIKSLYTDGENNNVECCWFYTIEETFLKGNRFVFVRTFLTEIHLF